MYVFIVLVKVTEWPPIGKIAAHSAYEMFSWYKYLIVSLVCSHPGFWSGNLFLIAPFPDLCLLVPFSTSTCVPWILIGCLSKSLLTDSIIAICSDWFDRTTTLSFCVLKTSRVILHQQLREDF